MFPRPRPARHQAALLSFRPRNAGLRIGIARPPRLRDGAAPIESRRGIRLFLRRLSPRARDDVAGRLLPRVRALAYVAGRPGAEAEVLVLAFWRRRRGRRSTSGRPRSPPRQRAPSFRERRPGGSISQ